MSRRLELCVKCGRGENWIECQYNSGAHGTSPPQGHTRKDEHLDYRCACGYEWEGDCLDASPPNPNVSPSRPKPAAAIPGAK